MVFSRQRGTVVWISRKLWSNSVRKLCCNTGLSRKPDTTTNFPRASCAASLRRFGYQVHIERLYTAVALDLGMPLTPDLVAAGACRADVAVYESGQPSAVIELKVFDAASPLPSVGLEVDKAQILGRFAKLGIFVGVMICPIIVSLEARIERLHDAFGGNMYIGERQHSRDRQWQWCFACASLRESERSY